MKPVWKRKYFVGFYFSILMALLLCVGTTPLMIRSGISLTNRFIVEEDVLETVLIIILFGISCLVLLRFMHHFEAYRKALSKADSDKSTLVSQLTEAFRYIGKVNVEIQVVESALCGLGCYPRSKSDFRRCVDQLLLKAMTIAAAPWMVVRMIDRRNGKTMGEHAVHGLKGEIPSVTMGNRALLDGLHHMRGMQSIRTCQIDLDFFTVLIMPQAPIGREETLLLTAVLNQIEMLFMLHRSDGLRQFLADAPITKFKCDPCAKAGKRPQW